MGRSLVQRGPTECGVSECDLETPPMRPRSTRGCPAIKRLFIKHSKKCKISKVGFSEIKEWIFFSMRAFQCKRTLFSELEYG
jgi:hypothetical protein